MRSIGDVSNDEFLEMSIETDRRPSPGMSSEVRATEELAESCPPKIEKLQTSGPLNGVPNVEAFLGWRTTKEHCFPRDPAPR